jgi:hypothetical protein
MFGARHHRNNIIDYYNRGTVILVIDRHENMCILNFKNVEHCNILMVVMRVGWEQAQAITLTFTLFLTITITVANIANVTTTITLTFE